MRQLVTNYTFNKQTGQVTLTDFAGGFDIERLYLITNVTRGKILYQFNSASLGATSNNNVITLKYDTSGMANTDKLQILYDYDYIAPGEDTQTNSLQIRPLTTEVSGTAGSNNSDLVPSRNVAAYKWGSMQLSGTFTATIQIQGSNDNINWIAIGVSNIGLVSQQAATSMTAPGMYVFPISYKFLRVRTVAFSSGPVVGNGQLYSTASFPAVVSAAITAQSALAVTSSSSTGAPVPTNAYYGGMLGQDGNLIGFRSAEVDSVTVGSLRTTPYFYNGASADRQRTISTIKNVYANAAGNTLLWAPTSGKRFRLLGCKVMATHNIAIASGGTLDIRLYDGAAASIGLSHTIYCPATAITNAPGVAFDSGWIDLKNGYISTAINNSLYVNLSAALSAGGVQVVVAGMEE